jgi:hypothetical protein
MAMGLATIAEVAGVLCVKCDGHAWRRVNGQWQMLGDSDNWFKCEIQDSTIRRQVADYECCLRSYSFDEGPDYPRANKKGNVGKFFRELQARELAACTKGIFAPVRVSYDPHAENQKRVALNMRRLASNTAWMRRYLTD